ncbi:MAG: carboxymuconolactone decarboxylase family protein [Armatimonadota bacterium]|jgi:AhpD family alkylhydroperoxidase|nr:alkylhydroperoxidase AhpD family core domain protein [Armatimonadota bacterium]
MEEQQINEMHQELIALASAYAGNCSACLAYHIRRALEVGATADQVRHAIEIASRVKIVAWKRSDELADKMIAETIIQAA